MLFCRAELDILLALLGHTSCPENVAFGLSLADPARVLLSSEQLPLSRAWDFLLVSQVPHQNHLCAQLEKFILRDSVLDEAFACIDILNLDRLS